MNCFQFCFSFAFNLNLRRYNMGGGEGDGVAGAGAAQRPPVGRCRLTPAEAHLESAMVSALETKISCNCFQVLLSVSLFAPTPRTWGASGCTARATAAWGRGLHSF